MLQFFKNANYDFIGKVRICLIISGAVILAGLLAAFIRGGWNLGVDFKGGTLVQIEFVNPVQIAQLRQALDGLGMGGAEVQNIGTDREVIIRVEKGTGANIGERIQIELKNTFPVKEIKREEMVGPKIGAELKDKALLAVLYSMVGLMVYIAWRFSPFGLRALGLGAGVIVVLQVLLLLPIPKLYINVVVFIGFMYLCWRLNMTFAVAAILALVHDVLVTMGFFAFLDKEITLTVLAALLTLVGYSLNDTIVIFDRIRENLRTMRGVSYAQLVNTSINQTLSRTIITSLTTFIVVVGLYFFGGAVIHDFAFAMFVGVITGSYSTIYIAAPILINMQDMIERQKKAATMKRMGR
jgi:preprotein translocase subunit SecF